jgi:hypothetical protein
MLIIVLLLFAKTSFLVLFLAESVLILVRKQVLEILSLTKISDKIQEYGIGILIVGDILMKY